MDGTGGDFSEGYRNPRQIALVAQLLRAATSIHTIDDLFLWLATTIVERCNVQVVQIWVRQAYRTGQASAEVRRTVRQDLSLPQQMITGTYVAEMAGRMMNASNNSVLQRVEDIFHPHQATLLKRYGLYYCCSYLLSSNGLLPPANDRLLPEKIPTPLRAVALLFLRQPLPPQMLEPIEHVLRQAIQFGEARALLLPPTPMPRMPDGPQSKLFQQRHTVPMDQLVPRRKEDAGLMSTSNPLTSISPIADKQARRLYAAIDGHRNMEELQRLARLTPAEVYKALRMLVAEHRIEVYDSRGQPVDSSLILDSP